MPLCPCAERQTFSPSIAQEQQSGPTLAVQPSSFPDMSRPFRPLPYSVITWVFRASLIAPGNFPRKARKGAPGSTCTRVLGHRKDVIASRGYRICTGQVRPLHHGEGQIVPRVPSLSFFLVRRGGTDQVGCTAYIHCFPYFTFHPPTKSILP